MAKRCKDCKKVRLWRDEERAREEEKLRFDEDIVVANENARIFLNMGNESIVFIINFDENRNVHMKTKKKHEQEFLDNNKDELIDLLKRELKVKKPLMYQIDY